MHQTLLIIAYLFTRLAFSDTALWDISRNTINRKTLRAFILDKNNNFFCIRRLLKSWLHCNHILFGPSVSNFLLAMHQTLLIIAYLFTRLAFSDTALWDISRNTIDRKTFWAFILDKNNKRFASEDCLRVGYIVITFYLVLL